MLQEAVAKLERALRGEPDEPRAVTKLAGFAALMRMGKPELVRIADLQSDEQYQRPIDREKVAGMRRAKAYRDPIKVNRRPDGSLWIVDGQHRAKAAEEDGLTHVRAWVADMPQQEEQHHETGVMKEVRRIPQGDSRRGRIHPGEFTGDDLAERDDEDTVGVTPYRGSAPPTEAYFDSPRWKHFITFAKQQANELGVSVDAMRKGTGMWMGEREPTSAWYVHDHDQVTTWAARVGEAFNQDAVAVFHEDDYGRHRLYQFTGIHPQRAMEAAVRVGLPAATVTGGTLTVIATDDKTDTRVLALAEELDKTPHSVAGRAQFIPREEYGRYAAADEASDEGEGAGDLPGGEGVAKEQGRIPAGDPRRGRIHPGEWTAEEARAQAVAAHEKAREEGREKPKDDQGKRDERESTSRRRRLAGSTKVKDLEDALSEADNVVDQVLVASRLGHLRHQNQGEQLELDVLDVEGLRERADKAREELLHTPWAKVHRTSEWRQARDSARDALIGQRIMEFNPAGKKGDPLSNLAYQLAEAATKLHTARQEKDGVDPKYRTDSWEEMTERQHDFTARSVADPLGRLYRDGPDLLTPTDAEFIPATDAERILKFLHEWVSDQTEDWHKAVKSGAVWEADARHTELLQEASDKADRDLEAARGAVGLSEIIREERAAQDPVLEPQSLRGVAQKARKAKGQPVAMFVEDSPLEDGVLYAEYAAPLRQTAPASINYAEADYQAGENMQPSLDGLKDLLQEPDNPKRHAASLMIRAVANRMEEVPIPAGMDIQEGASLGRMLTDALDDAIERVKAENPKGFGLSYQVDDLLDTPLWFLGPGEGDEYGGTHFYLTPDDARKHWIDHYRDYDGLRHERPFDPDEQEITLRAAMESCVDDVDTFMAAETSYGDGQAGWPEWVSTGEVSQEWHDAAFGTVRPDEEERVVKALLAHDATVEDSQTALGGYSGSWAYRSGMEAGKVFSVWVNGKQVTYLPHTSVSTQHGRVAHPVLRLDPETAPARVREYTKKWVSQYAQPVPEGGIRENAFVPLESVLPGVETPTPMMVPRQWVSAGRTLDGLAEAVEGLPHALEVEGKRETMPDGTTPEEAAEQIKGWLVGRNMDMYAAAKHHSLSREQWCRLMQAGAVDVTVPEPQVERLAGAVDNPAPFSERGKLRVEDATPAEAVKCLKALGLTTGLAEQVPYNVLYHGEHRVGRVQPRLPEFVATGRKLDSDPGQRVVIHGLTAKDENTAGLIESLIESGGVMSTAERRRMGIDVRTESVAGDTGSGIDQYVFCTYNDTPQFGQGAWLLLKPTVLERRDIAFAPTDFGGGSDRWTRYNGFANQIGQGKFTDPPDIDARNRAIDMMDHADAEVLLKHSIPWEDVDTLFVSEDAERVKDLVDEAKKAGKLPQNLRVVEVDSVRRDDLNTEIAMRERVLRRAYEAA